MRYPALLLTLLLSGAALAAAPSDQPPGLTPVPDGPPGADDTATVSIKSTKEGTVEEYRTGKQVYMTKITPKVGKPYYMVDPIGNGRFNRMETLPGLQPPQWVIKDF
jgi:hypothetical protein